MLFSQMIAHTRLKPVQFSSFTARLTYCFCQGITLFIHLKPEKMTFSARRSKNICFFCHTQILIDPEKPEVTPFMSFQFQNNVLLKISIPVTHVQSKKNARNPGIILLFNILSSGTVITPVPVVMTVPVVATVTIIPSWRTVFPLRTFHITFWFRKKRLTGKSQFIITIDIQ